MSDRRYPIAYKVEPDASNLTAAELRERQLGGCDRIIIHSIIGKAGDGQQRSEVILHRGPDGEGLDGQELFSSWVMLAKHVMEAQDLGPGRRALAEAVFETVRHLVAPGHGPFGAAPPDFWDRLAALMTEYRR